MNWKGQTFTKAYDVCQALLAIKTKSEAVEFCRVYASAVSMSFDEAMDNLRFGVGYFSNNKMQDRKANTRRRWIEAAREGGQA